MIQNESVVSQAPAPEWSATTALVRAPPRTGVVVIGRNEGERLRSCLRSLRGAAHRLVYVDSGSTDGSVELARSMGVSTVELDLRMPFAPGRARNEGFRRLRELVPDLDYVQFVDGDCEVSTGWLEQAVGFLRANRDVAVLGGHRRERYPDRSVYNLLCAMEWETHLGGEVKSCGGDALMRADAFAAVGGFRPDLMAGEEPELCRRLRAAGWRIWFLDAPLTLHDAAMMRFGQWWRRAARSGYGAMQQAFSCTALVELAAARDLLSCWIWALALPLVTVALALAWSSWAWGLLLAYPAQVIRVAVRDGAGDSWGRSVRYSVFLLLAKLPKLVGQVTCLVHRWSRRPARLIEYKL